MQSRIPRHWYWFLQPLQHNQVAAISLVLVWLWPSCCCLQWERVCLSLPACISDRSTPGNRLQRGTVSALPSVYRASCSACRCDRGMPGGIAMCMCQVKAQSITILHTCAWGFLCMEHMVLNLQQQKVKTEQKTRQNTMYCHDNTYRLCNSIIVFH